MQFTEQKIVCVCINIGVSWKKWLIKDPESLLLWMKQWYMQINLKLNLIRASKNMNNLNKVHVKAWPTNQMTSTQLLLLSAQQRFVCE